MTLATRTGLAAMTASIVAVLALVGVATRQYEDSIRNRVDEQLAERADTAPILAAVSERVATSELSATVDSARVSTDGREIPVGALPGTGLPPLDRPGWRTVDVGDEQWRLYAVVVADLPEVGDSTLVEFAAPLGDVNDQLRLVRRGSIAAGILTSIAAGLVGWLLGRRAVRPLLRLQHDTRSVGHGPPDTWSVADSYANREVDDVAEAINTTLDRLGHEIEQRQLALESARAFAASAAHELRTPLQSALTNVDIVAASEDPAATSGRLTAVRNDIERMGHTLRTVNALAQADLLDTSQFEAVDLADLVDESLVRYQSSGVSIRYRGDDHAPATVWPDGVRLALDNLLRNALTHGRPPDDSPPLIQVTVDASTSSIIVDDNGPGVRVADRDRVLEAYERATERPHGTGLGLALVGRIARAHGGTVRISTSETGGARVTVTLAHGFPPPNDAERSARAGPGDGRR